MIFSNSNRNLKFNRYLLTNTLYVMKNLKISFLIGISILCLTYTSCQKEEITTEGATSTVQNEVKTDLDAWIKEALEKEVESTSKKNPPIQTVNFVDLNRYTGRWYEIANFPTFFNKDCSCTTADYELLEDAVGVFNNCISSVTGQNNSVNGKAVVVDTTSNAKLKVLFPPSPIPGDYWIIDLVSFDEDKPYNFSVVSNSDRSSLFILSRTPKITTVKQKIAIIGILINLIKQGYDIRKIQLTTQNDSCIYPSEDV